MNPLVFLCLGASLAASCRSALPARLGMAPAPHLQASALEFWRLDRPQERLLWISCEALLDGNRDFGLYAIAPKASDWREVDGAWSYRYRTEPGLLLEFTARVAGDALEWNYRLENHTTETLEDAHLHPCLSTQGAPSFYPGDAIQAQRDRVGRAARAGKQDYRELWQRVWLYTRESRFALESCAAARDSQRLALVPQGSAPLTWSWWQSSPERFAAPWMVIEDHERQQVLALAFERVRWASSNASDARACVHLFPHYGRLAPGESKQVRGRLLWTAGTSASIRSRLEQDFPIPSKP